jgi:hypothetical protein
MPLAQAIARICEVFLLSPSAVDELKLGPLSPDTTVDADLLTMLAWQFRINHPSDTLDDFLKYHRYSLLAWDTCY